MIIKVCGMHYPENIRKVADLGVNWMGFIFYEKSPRFIGSEERKIITDLSTLPVKKVGVFVNATFEQMMEAVDTYLLDYLQLHGEESPELCHRLQKRGISLIKAFPVSSEEDLLKATAYEDRVDYFLFDTKCNGYGGSGKRFDWSILSSYHGKTPFLLSGGINPESLEALIHFSHPCFAGIDLNSGFETEPGLKDIKKLQLFIQQLKENKR